MKKELLAFFDFVCGVIGIGAGTYFQAPFFSVAGTLLMCFCFNEVHHLMYHHSKKNPEE